MTSTSFYVPSPQQFFDEGKPIFNGRRKTTKRRQLHTDLDRFRSFFGTWPCICSEIWRRCNPKESVLPKVRAVHLLWALLLMNCYSTEVVNGALAGVDEDTFRKWSMPWIPVIASLAFDVIKWENRFAGNWHFWTYCVDGIHTPIQEPRTPFWSKWWSHKFQGAGLAYEMATAVSTGWIIWLNGPFPATWPDNKIFKNALKDMPIPGVEMGVSDIGYRGCQVWIFLPFWRTKKNMENKVPRNDLHEHIRARHEQTNGRLHNWNCIGTIFRHSRELHQDFFYAVAVITQLEIMHGFAKQFSVVPRPAIDAETYEATPDPEEAY